MPDRFKNRLAIMLKETTGGNQTQFAKLTHVTQPFISMLLTGEREPPFSFLQALCIELKYNPQWVLLGFGERKIGKNTVSLLTEVEAFRADVAITNNRIDVINKKMQDFVKRFEKLESQVKTV